MTYTITADGKECFETEIESEAQEMLTLLIVHQQDEPSTDSAFETVRKRQKIMRELWKSEHPIAEKLAETRVYEIKTTNHLNE